MIRFFVAPSDVSGGLIRLCEEDAAHIRSLRLRPGEPFTVCDGMGVDYACHLGERGDGSVAQIVEARPSRGEPSVACVVYIAFAKGERLDYAVQKSVELGAYGIVLFPSERCVSAPGDVAKKIARLQRIALETAKQCGRGRVPVVRAAGSFASAIAEAVGGREQFTIHNAQCTIGDGERGGGQFTMHNAQCTIGDGERGGGQFIIHNAQCTIGDGERGGCGLPLFFYECEEELHLKQVLEQWLSAAPREGALGRSGGQFTMHNAQCTIGDVGRGGGDRYGAGRELGTVAIVTGPEGGFTPQEAEAARSAGLFAVSLGPRILRCETAPVVALAAVMLYTGNL